MKINTKILESDTEISRRIIKALFPEVKKLMNSAINKIKNNLPTVINNALRNSPEYNSLVSGKLKLEFGIPDSAQKVANLIDIWSKNIYIKYDSPQISSNKIKASFSASMIKIDFTDVLYTEFAYLIDRERGYSLPWLRWLLLEGQKPLVKNYEVLIGPNSRSRTGLAVMTDSKKSWKVPAEFSGTISDNWITRTIDSAKSDIYAIIEDIFK